MPMIIEGPESAFKKIVISKKTIVNANERFKNTPWNRATKTIGEMISIIKKLIEKGHAYVVDSDVYFDVKSFKEYGKLSHQPLENLEAGARIEVGEKKKNPMDFAVWKAAKPGEPYWDSPWGKGRPGWHIECSAMSMKYLGESFDIHTGGIDNLSPVKT